MNPTDAMQASAGLISAQDLLSLVKNTGKTSFLRMHSQGNLFHSVKWKQRFVILANSSMYIYDNEISKKPHCCIPLLGYNQIKRYASEKYPWSFSLMGAVKSVKQRTFSCATEEERRQWMRKIKEHLYKANEVERPFFDLNQLMSGTEQEYEDLEELVFLPEDVTIPEKEKCPDFSDAESVTELEDDEDEEEDISGGILKSRRSTRKMSTTSSMSKGERELPPIPGGESSEVVIPPRYSHVMADHPYQNDGVGEDLPKPNRTKTEACLISDPNLERDREACKALLLSKCDLGVHLIRKSRSDDNFVLMVLTEDSKIREYRLEENNHMYRLSAKEDADFLTLDNLLHYFSHKVCPPNLKHYLTFGIHECEDETYQDLGS